MKEDGRSVKEKRQLQAAFHRLQLLAGQGKRLAAPAAGIGPSLSLSSAKVFSFGTCVAVSPGSRALHGPPGAEDHGERLSRAIFLARYFSSRETMPWPLHGSSYCGLLAPIA